MRNPLKYVYVTIGIPRGSPELAELLREADRFEIGLPKLISMLLIDRHQALRSPGSGVWFPKGYLANTPLSPLAEEEEDGKLSETMEQRAFAAAAAWDED